VSDLVSSQIFWLAATLAVFEGADILSRRSGRHPLCHPVLWATPVMIALLLMTRTSYPTYLGATQVLGFLLGPAVVGLAVPIWARRALIGQLAAPITLALCAGSITASVSAVAILSLFGAPHAILASIAPRAVTTPVAMAMAQALGGVPSLAAVIVLFAGVVGAMAATPVFNLLKIRDYRARGFAIGVSAHGFGTARAFQVDHTAGAFASLGMALNAIATCLLLSVFGFLI
jgi:putative effector of murein hydrolase